MAMCVKHFGDIMLAYDPSTTAVTGWHGDVDCESSNYSSWEVSIYYKNHYARIHAVVVFKIDKGKPKHCIYVTKQGVATMYKVIHTTTQSHAIDVDEALAIIGKKAIGILKETDNPLYRAYN